MFRRLVDMLTRRPPPPHDERSRKAAQLDTLEGDVRDVALHVDRLVPHAAPLRRELDRAVRVIQAHR